MYFHPSIHLVDTANGALYTLLQGTHTGQFIYPSLFLELICSVLAVNNLQPVCTKWSLSFLSVRPVLCLHPQPSSSVAFYTYKLFYMVFTSVSLHLFLFLTLCFFQSHCVYPLFHLPSLLFRLPYCFGHTALLCCLSRERDNFLLRLPDSHHPAQ